MSEIAARAGVVASVLYDHFPSKRELHIELLQTHAEALIDRATRTITATSPKDLLRAACEAYFSFVEDDPYAWRLLFRDPPSDPEIAAVHQRIERGATQAIASLAATVRPSEQLNPNIPRETVDMMVAEAVRSVVNGLAAWWYDHRELRREQVVDVAFNILWRGLGQLATGQ
jgi:AcrR family transcriptional regulator